MNQTTEGGVQTTNFGLEIHDRLLSYLFCQAGAQHSFQCASKQPIQKGRPWRWTGSGRQNREHTPTSTDYIHKSWQTTGIFVYLCHCEIHEISGSVVWRHLDHSSSCPGVASVLITLMHSAQKKRSPRKLVGHFSFFWCQLSWHNDLSRQCYNGVVKIFL